MTARSGMFCGCTIKKMGEMGLRRQNVLGVTATRTCLGLLNGINKKLIEKLKLKKLPC